MEHKNTYFDANEIKWEDPKPLKKEASDRWNRVKQELMNRPNEWAIIAHSDSETKFNVSLIKQNNLGNEFDITCRHSGKQRTVYARYVGKLNEEES